MGIKTRSHVVMLLVGVMLAPSMASGGQAPGTTSQTLAAVAVEHAANTQADRQTVLNVLERQDVRKLAKRAGLPIAKAAAAVATLDGAELAQAMEQARHVNDALAGGQRPWWKPSASDLRTAILIVIPMAVLLWLLGKGYIL